MNEASTIRGGSGRKADEQSAVDAHLMSPFTSSHTPARADAQVAKALASLPAYSEWAHRPIPAEVEQAVMNLTPQQLMTTAAVCLLRLAKENAA